MGACSWFFELFVTAIVWVAIINERNFSAKKVAKNLIFAT